MTDKIDRSGKKTESAGTSTGAVDGTRAGTGQDSNLYGESFDALLDTLSAGSAWSAPETAAVSGIAPKVIGWVRSPLHKLDDCPISDEGAPEAVLEILPEYSEGLLGLRVGQRIEAVTWLHLAGRDVLQVQGHRGKSGATRGVFSTRSPMRPNPIGLHEAMITSLENDEGTARIGVNALEALDGTPILDIKASSRLPGPSGPSGLAGLAGQANQSCESEQAGVDGRVEILSGAEIDAARKELACFCRDAHATGLLSGFNGNASLRLGPACLITRSGSLKADLRDRDFALLDISSGVLLDGTAPSSEAKVHLEIYRSQPKALAVLHTHPPKMMALGLRLPDLAMEKRLEMPVFEADLLRSRLATTERFEPGSHEVAEAAGTLASAWQAVWLEGHGLCVWAEDMRGAFGLSEELEHLAGVRLAGL